MHNKTIIQRRYACQTMFEELEIRNILAKSILPSSHNIIYMDLAKIVYGNITDLRIWLQLSAYYALFKL